MSGNAHRVGRSVSLTKDDLWYFDRLPPTARQALANAEHEWSSGALYNRWQKAKPGYKTGQQCAERVKQWDASVKTRKRGLTNR
jgi:hypothetical protein